MSIENILQQKAAAKAAREAELVHQQQEQEAAVAEAERLQKQEAEEAHFAGLRKSMTDIDTEVGQVQSHLAELQQAHEQAQGSVVGAKKERQKLAKATTEINNLFTNKEFSQILEEEGIKSLDDLLRAEEYSGQEQVKTVKGLRQSYAKKRQTAREHIRTRRQVKVEVHKAITAEKPVTLPKPTYKEVVGALEKLVQDLGNERQKLYYQTPEGQEALKAEIFNRVKQRRKNIRLHYNLSSVQGINQVRTIAEGDLEDVGRYGEDQVKDAIKDCCGQFIDEELAEKAQKDGYPQLREAIETMELVGDSRLF